MGELEDAIWKALDMEGNGTCLTLGQMLSAVHYHMSKVADMVYTEGDLIRELGRLVNEGRLREVNVLCMGDHILSPREYRWYFTMDVILVIRGGKVTGEVR